MKELEYQINYDDDDPGNIVEALNTDRSYTLYEVDPETGRGAIVMIHPEYIKVKIINK